MYRDPIEANCDVLSVLLEYGKEILYKKSLQGYGLYDSEFNLIKKGKKPIISRRAFGDRKKELLKRRFIIELLSAGSQKHYYAISPLGIAYLCRNLLKLNPHQANRIITNLRFFHENFRKKNKNYLSEDIKINWKNAWDLLEKYQNQNYVLEKLHDSCRLINIKENDMDNEILFEYSFRGKKLELSKDRIHLTETPGLYRPSMKTFHPKTHHDLILFDHVCDFILHVFFHSIFMVNVINVSTAISSKIIQKKRITPVKNQRHVKESIDRITLFNQDIYHIVSTFNSKLNFLFKQQVSTSSLTQVMLNSLQINPKLNVFEFLTKRMKEHIILP